MDINSILNGVKCDSCGKMHECSIKYIYIENGACKHLSELCMDFKSILLVADENTFGACGDRVVSALGSKQYKSVIFSGKSVVIPNEDAIERVRGELEGVDLIIGIGSGVMQDLCKYVAHFAGIPYMVVATAPSMDGYASNGAAMILKGMKETVPATLPYAILADTEVLKNAPMDMIKAGYGDIIGKYSALNDWELSRVVNNEYFCQYIYDVTYDMILKTLNTAEGLIKRDENSVKILTEALMIVGIMMSFATSSRPASGSEHHLSHFFEITGIINNEEYFPHGIDVVYSTVITSKIREIILKNDFPAKSFSMDRDTYENKMSEVYSVIASECIKLQDRIGNYTRDRLPIYKEKEEEIRDILAKMPSPEKIKEMLMLAKIDYNEFYKLYGKDKINTAVHYAKDLKDRYTVLWMYYDLFGVSYEIDQ
ncbi:MAG: sn-glycerol-1-phosphate dehydrogenase [Clostridia bacterium]|nr:sn-glycerol-1-phosphate dehydrogenase [Clostridia bacterium]